MMSANTSARSRSPFTATQWQELEHQALIFKYMVSGVPIPPDLIYSVRRSMDSSFSSRLFTNNPIGWGCFEMGFSRKIDPEPGRCRRTDGKKWRCSKEAYPDSKYCERHMHRGRNRSRKPVELVSSTTTTTTTISPITSPPNFSSTSMNRSLLSTSTNSTISPYSSSPMPSEPLSHFHPHPNSSLYPFMYPHSSSSSRTTPYVLPPENNPAPYFSLKPDSYSQADKEYRLYHGTKESLDELAFFPESSGNSRSLPETCNHPLLSSSSYMGYSQPQYQSYTENNSKEPKQSDSNQQHCFVLGTDFKSARPIKSGEKEPETQKPLHHFFGEWPPKNSDSWLDLASNSRIQSP